MKNRSILWLLLVLAAPKLFAMHNRVPKLTTLIQQQMIKKIMQSPGPSYAQSIEQLPEALQTKYIKNPVLNSLGIPVASIPVTANLHDNGLLSSLHAIGSQGIIVSAGNIDGKSYVKMLSCTRYDNNANPCADYTHAGHLEIPFDQQGYTNMLISSSTHNIIITSTTAILIISIDERGTLHHTQTIDMADKNRGFAFGFKIHFNEPTRRLFIENHQSRQTNETLDSILIYQYDNQKKCYKSIDHKILSNPIHHMAIQADGHAFVTAGEYGPIQEYIEQGGSWWMYRGYHRSDTTIYNNTIIEGRIIDLFFDNNHNQLVVCSQSIADNTLFIYRLPSLRSAPQAPIIIPLAQENYCTSIAHNPLLNILTVDTNTRQKIFFDIHTGKHLSPNHIYGNQHLQQKLNLPFFTTLSISPSHSAIVNLYDARIHPFKITDNDHKNLLLGATISELVLFTKIHAHAGQEKNISLHEDWNNALLMLAHKHLIPNSIQNQCRIEFYHDDSQETKSKVASLQQLSHNEIIKQINKLNLADKNSVAKMAQDLNRLPEQLRNDITYDIKSILGRYQQRINLPSPAPQLEHGIRDIIFKDNNTKAITLTDNHSLYEYNLKNNEIIDILPGQDDDQQLNSITFNHTFDHLITYTSSRDEVPDSGNVIILAQNTETNIWEQIQIIGTNTTWREELQTFVNPKGELVIVDFNTHEFTVYTFNSNQKEYQQLHTYQLNQSSTCATSNNDGSKLFIANKNNSIDIYEYDKASNVYEQSDIIDIDSLTNKEEAGTIFANFTHLGATIEAITYHQETGNFALAYSWTHNFEVRGSYATGYFVTDNKGNNHSVPFSHDGMQQYYSLVTINPTSDGLTIKGYEPILCTRSNYVDQLFFNKNATRVFLTTDKIESESNTAIFSTSTRDVILRFEGVAWKKGNQIYCHNTTIHEKGQDYFIDQHCGNVLAPFGNIQIDALPLEQLIFLAALAQQSNIEDTNNTPLQLHEKYLDIYNAVIEYYKLNSDYRNISRQFVSDHNLTQTTSQANKRKADELKNSSEQNSSTKRQNTKN